MRPGKHFENRTAQIIKQLNPGANVIQNVKLDGKLSEVKREIDVQLVGPDQYDYLAFECKDKTRTIDVPIVDAFHTKCLDVSAKRKAIISNSPYSKAAVNMASKLNIGLLHLVDTDDPSIRSKLCAPAFLEDTSCRTFSVGLRTQDPAALFRNPIMPTELVLLDSSGNEWTAYSIFSQLWNKGVDLKSEPGQYIYHPPQNNLRARNMHGQIINLSELSFRYVVETRYFVGPLDITETQGIYDNQRKTYQTQGFTLQPVEPAALEEEWEIIADPAEAKKGKAFGFNVMSMFPENPADL